MSKVRLAAVVALLIATLFGSGTAVASTASSPKASTTSSPKALPDCNAWFGEYQGVAKRGEETGIVSIHYSGLSRWLGFPGLVIYQFSKGTDSGVYTASLGGGQHGVRYPVAESGKWVVTVFDITGKAVCDEYIAVITSLQ